MLDAETCTILNRNSHCATTFTTQESIWGKGAEFYVIWKDDLLNNKNYDLFIFAGQSNMMGASAIPPEHDDTCNSAFEYHFNLKRRGNATGSFVRAKHPAGEWSYIDIKKAYTPGNVDSQGRSMTADYLSNTFFVPAMASRCKDGEEKSFASFSESTAQTGQSLPPFFAKEYAGLGHRCVYAHMAKGCASIDYYLDVSVKAFFEEKYNSMVADFPILMQDCIISSRNFVWCQGESDNGMTKERYEEKLGILWAWLQSLGFENFFIIRVGYWGTATIAIIMAAQEEFCKKNAHCYIVTRAESFMPYPGMDTSSFFITEPEKAFHNCRDSYLGYDNNHINSKGNKLIAKRTAENISRILHEGLNPVLEEENVAALVSI
jgi:hypothetical protein